MIFLTPTVKPSKWDSHVCGAVGGESTVSKEYWWGSMSILALPKRI